jgi:cytoskeleton protein RodZ
MAKVTRLSSEAGIGLERRRLHLREISSDADAPLESVGQDLRAARLRHGEDLASVYTRLKIRSDYLEAIEESRFDRLPGRPYAIGFVRSYADYMGLNSRSIVERYKAEIAGLGPEPSALDAIDSEPERKFPHAMIFAGLVVLLAIAHGGYYLSVSTTETATQPDTTVPERLAAIASPSAPVPVPLPAPVPPPAPVVAEVGSAPAVPPPPAPEAAPQPTAAEAAAALPAGRVLGTQNANSRITVRVHESASILIRGADERLFINRTLGPGDVYHAPNLPGMTITTSNSGALELILDDESVGYLGNPGEPATALLFSPQSIVDRARQTSG